MSQQSLAWDMKMLLATIKVIFLPEGMDLILEVKTKREKELVQKVAKTEGLLSVSLLAHEGEIKA